MKAHKTVSVRVGIMEAQIDVELAPLIEEIWMADIFTLNSCEENQPGIAWIQFETSDDASRFLDIVAGNTTTIYGDCTIGSGKNGRIPMDRLKGLGTLPFIPSIAR